MTPISTLLVFEYLMVSYIPAIIGLIFSVLGYVIHKSNKDLIINLLLNGIYLVIYLMGTYFLYLGRYHE